MRFLHVLIFFLLVSCAGDRVWFSESRPIPSDGWGQNEPITLEFDVVDTNYLYDFYVDLRHDDRYGFSNLFLFSELKFPNGKLSNDTLECTLADARGEWLGLGGGSIREAGFQFYQRKRFPIPGRYIFTIHQGMRTEVLVGILDAGLRIEKSF